MAALRANARSLSARLRGVARPNGVSAVVTKAHFGQCSALELFLQE